jgi:hypothetical protein
MANTYSSTNLLEARAMITPEMEKKFERRKNLTQAMNLFLMDREYSIPDLAEIKEADVQTTKVWYKKRKSFTKITAKSCTPTGETGGSAIATVSWSQMGFKVIHQAKKYHNNEIKGLQGLAYDLMEGEASFWFDSDGFDATLIAYLEANRTQVAKDLADGTHNDFKGNPQYFYEVANADSPRFYNYLIPEMNLNNYSGELLELHNTMWGAEIAYDGAQGPGNNINTQFQFREDVTRFKTNLLTPPSYYFTEQFIIPRGGVALLDWNDPLNRQGKVTEAGEWTTYESKFFPGIKFDLFIKNSCSDTTADGGTTQDSVTNYEFILNYAAVKQPMSTANETPIFKYMQLSP